MKTTRLAFFFPVLFFFLLLAGCGPSGKGSGSKDLPGGGAASASRIVEVVYLEGEVRVNGSTVEPGARLGTKFVVTTGPASRCDIVFDRGNALSVGQNAVAEFDLAEAQGLLRLHAGGVGAVLKQLARQVDKDSFIIRTAQGVAGVRGTSFCVWADASSAYVCACNGVVGIGDTKGGEGEVLEAAHHMARIYKADADGSITKEAAGMLHHSDALLQSVASRIGYTIDWSKVDK
jgi:hypothetical protein